MTNFREIVTKKLFEADVVDGEPKTNEINIVNLTPHSITLCGKTIESTGLARCTTTKEKIGEINGVPVNRTSFGSVTGLPEPQENTIYIVSKIVADAVSKDRDDVYIVDDTVRNEAGQIIGCNALARV